MENRNALLSHFYFSDWQITTGFVGEGIEK